MKDSDLIIEFMGQQMTFLNDGPAHALTPAFSYPPHERTRAEIDRYRDKLPETLLDLLASPRCGFIWPIEQGE